MRPRFLWAKREPWQRLTHREGCFTYQGSNVLHLAAADLRALLVEGYDGRRLSRVMIDGGDTNNISIVGDELGQIDLRHLTNREGDALPALVLRNCLVLGSLDISGSHLAGLAIIGGALRSLMADATQVDSDIEISDVQPLSARMDEREWDVASAKRHLHPKDWGYCQLRITGCGVDGSFTLRKANLVAPERDYWPRQTPEAPASAEAGAASIQPCATGPDHWKPITADPTGPGGFANRFALSLACSEIKGRVNIARDVTIEGGMSLYQAIVRNSVRIKAKQIKACRLRDGERADDWAVAVSAEEVRVGGAFLWLPDKPRRPTMRHSDKSPDAKKEDDECRIVGRVILLRARIDSDVVFDRCVFEPLDTTKDSAFGDIDLRRATVGGQLAIYDGCSFGTRQMPAPGRQNTDVKGSSLDAWKAEFLMGVIVYPKTHFAGPVLFNSARICKSIEFGGCVVFENSWTKPELLDGRSGVYQPGLSFSGARIEGETKLSIEKISGRLEFDGAMIEGNLELQQVNWLLDSGPSQPRDEQSILDMQDLRVSGGINLKRGEITVRLSPPLASSPADPYADGFPNAGIIVDLRGLQCASWDDADATAWKGLVSTEKRLRRGSIDGDTAKELGLVPWRLRFSGAKFSRVEESYQRPLVPQRATEPSPAERFLEHFFAIDAVRDFSSLGRNEFVRFRLLSLASYHDNRAPEQAHKLPRRAWILLKHLVWRGVFESSARRRERIPPFSSQPYDEFARAYSTRGDWDIAARISIRRLEFQWHRRTRFFAQMIYRKVILIAAGVAFLCWRLSTVVPDLLPAWGWGWALVPAAFGAMPIILRVLVIPVFQHGFGFGHRGDRAILSGILFAIVVGATPLLLPWWKDKRCASVREIKVVEHLAFGFDKLLPVDIKQAERFKEACGIPSENESGPAALHVLSRRGDIAVSIGEAGSEDQETKTFAQQLRIADGFLDVIGALVLAVWILTVTGVLRRDIDRKVDG